MDRDNKWLDKLADQMEAYEEEAPSFIWDTIEKDMAQLNEEGPSKVLPMFPQKMWWSMAAALFVGVLSYSLYLLSDRMTTESDGVRMVAHDTYPKSILPVIDEIKNIKTEPSLVANDLKISLPSHKSGSSVKINKAVSQSASVLGSTRVVNVVNEEDEDNIERTDEVIAVDETFPSEDINATEGKKQENIPAENRKYDNLYDNVDYSNILKTQKKNSSGDVGVNVGSAGTFNMNGVTADGTTTVLREVQLESFASPSALEKLDGRKFTLKNGVPFEEETIKTKEYKHDQPISFGLSYRKPFNNKLALETGLLYTYLSSDVKELDTKHSYKQKLHYLGVPVKINWSFLEYNRFSFYAAAGGTMEFAVSGTVDGKSKRPTRPQFSLQGGVGGQFAFTNHVGFYIEPGVSYYFNDGSGFETIRREKPFNFNLNMGFRFTF